MCLNVVSVEVARRGLPRPNPAASRTARASVHRGPSEEWYATAYAVLGVGLALILLGAVSGAWTS